MAASMAFSLLVHWLVLYSLTGWLLPRPIQPGKDSLEVRLALRPQTGKAPVPNARQDERLLAGQPSPEFEIATPVQEVVKPPIEQPPAPPDDTATIPVAAEPAPASTPPGEAAGVSIPGAVASPWGGPVRPANQLRRQDYYRQMMESKARQQFEQQTQLLIGQLHRLLGERIRAQGGDVEGKCELAGLADSRDKRLVCEPSSLEALLKSDEKGVVEMLLVLRARGKMFDGFSAAFRDEQLNLKLHVEEPREH